MNAAQRKFQIHDFHDDAIADSIKEDRWKARKSALSPEKNEKTSNSQPFLELT